MHSPYSRGLAGHVNFTDDHLYICTDTNFWKRIDLDKSKWFAPESIAISLNSGNYPSITEIYFSGLNAIVNTDGDPFPAKSSTNLQNDGVTPRLDFFNAYQITDKDQSFSFRYRGGKNSASPESAVSGFNGMFANGVFFASPRAGTESVGIYTPPTGFHYNRSHFATHFKMDDCGGYVNFDRAYSYYNGNFLTRCWDDPLVYNNNPYYKLILLFLYLGVIGLAGAVQNRPQGSKILAILVLVGFLDIPIIHYSVNWWQTLHQGASLQLLAKPTISGSMLWPLLVMIVGLMSYCAAVILRRAQIQVLHQEQRCNWVKQWVQHHG
ncbi:MAG: hypothetical protein GKR77_06700 [Legionellales bacterium]|nr:hypothetical protein [Legionellales bacterium]